MNDSNEICPFDFCGKSHVGEQPSIAEMHEHARLAWLEIDAKGIYSTEIPGEV